jgi:hypothetical protein
VDPLAVVLIGLRRQRAITLDRRPVAVSSPSAAVIEPSVRGE